MTTRIAAHTLRCLVNAVRLQHGLSPLRADPRLAAAARHHAADMAAHDFFAHDSPSAGTMQARVTRAGYLRSGRAWSLGEALAWGTARAGAPRAILRGLLASPPHRAILLSPAFRDLGVGVAHGAPRGRDAGALTVALDFGRVQR
ncbi:MAG TPA: CAP domain-containing protein [Baekduia sp.]|nr:CAP domain-containing protein [Baekduia sp.]